MALTKLVKINDKLGWALWKIDTDWQQLLACSNFQSEDLQAIETISHPQKKAEYLASRLALHQLLKAFQMPQTSIIKDIYGKPYAKHGSYHISLANSFPYGVAVLNLDQITGIDIERPSDKLLRVQHKFLHEQEAHLQHQADNLCLAWCTKECLYKLHGRKRLSFKHHIRITEIQYPSKPYIYAEIYYDQEYVTYKLLIEQVENYFIVMSL